MSLSTPVATNEMPQIQVLAGFGATSASFPWTDISQYVRAGQINRPANRLAGPLYQYQAGTLTLQLKNGDARFDPDNLSGPYVTTLGLQGITQVFNVGALEAEGAPIQGNTIEGNITIPDNLNGTTINVTCVAAGGGGGSGSNITQAAAGGGGGGGEWAQEEALTVTPGGNYSFSIGLPGAGGTATTRSGSPGGDTLFPGDGGVLVHAHGGSGGSTGIATGTGGSTGQTQGAGGLGGFGSVNTTSGPGGPGGSGGQNSNGTAASGGGGSSGGAGATGNTGGTGDGQHHTPGGAPVSAGGPGGNGGGPKDNGKSPPALPGGGGGGGSGERDGGSGAPGQIIISYTVIVPASARTEVLPEVPVRVIGAYAHNQTVNFENGLGAWTSLNSGNVTVDTTQSLWGQSSAKIVPPGGQSAPGMQSEFILIGTGVTQISASLMARAAAAYGFSVKLDINWYDSAKTFISTASGLSLVLPAAAWTQVANLGNTPPGNAAYFRMLFKLNGTPANTAQVNVDQAVGAPGPNAGAFALFTGYVDSWADTGIVNPNDPGGPQTGAYQGYAEMSLSATDAFEVLSLASLPVLASPIDSGNDAGGRIASVLAAIGWPSSLQQIDTSPVLVQGTDYGDNALSLMQIAAQTDGGDLFIDGAGNVTFFTRNHVLTTASSYLPQAVFGDRPGTAQDDGTELPYSAVVRVSDNTTLFNDIQITPVSGIDPLVPVPTLAEATDQASIAQFLFVRSYQDSSMIQLNQPDALNLAQWVLYIAKDSEDRIDQLSISPQRDPGDLYYQALGRTFTDEIEFWRRPPGMYTPIVKFLGIRGISHTWDFSTRTFDTVWTLQDFTKYSSFLRLDDNNSGRLGYNALAF